MVKIAGKSVVRLTDRPDMTLDVYRGRKTTMQCNNVVKINITGHEKKSNLHFNLKIIFHCICIEKLCIFSNLVQLITKV